MSLFTDALGSVTDPLLGTNFTGINSAPDPITGLTAGAENMKEKLGFDQSVLDNAQSRRTTLMNDLLARRGGIDQRATESFRRGDLAYDRARTAEGYQRAGLQQGMGLADRIGGMAGRDSQYFRGLEGQAGTLGGRTQALGQETRGLQAGSQGLSGQLAGLGGDIGEYRGQLDQLRKGGGRSEALLRKSLSARATEGIQRNVAGQKLAMERSLASRGIDPTSMKALTAMGSIDANAQQQKRLAQQDANFNALNMSQQRMNQRANLIQAGMGAVGQQGGMLGQQANLLGQQQGMVGQRQNFVNARQNLLNNLRQGRAQEFGMDQSALGAGMQGMYGGAGQYGGLANRQQAFGVAQNQIGSQNVQMGIGLDQAGVQDNIFDINRMDQKLLSAEQIKAGVAGQQAMANANAQAAHSQSQAQQQSNTMGTIGTIAMAKLMFSCIPEGGFIDVAEDYKVNIRDIQVGQKVIGYNGEQVKVLQKHEYLEDPEARRHMCVTFTDGSEIKLSDTHRINNVRCMDLKVGGKMQGKKITSVVRIGGVKRSYDLVTEDMGYQIEGVSVNSMIGEMAEMISDLRKVA